MELGQTDPELLRQLDDAIKTGEPVQAVVKLHRTPGKAPVPAFVEEQTRQAVDRAAETTGEQPTDVHVLGRLATAYVSGSEKFLREFFEQPEVASAVANQVSPAATSPSLGSGSAGAAPAEGVNRSSGGQGTAGAPPSDGGSEQGGISHGGGGRASAGSRRSTPRRSVPRD